MGREAKILNKLTRKQNAFVKGILLGKNPTQSAMSVYDVANSKTASVIASENLSKPNVKEALDEALRTNGLTVDVIASNIGNLANKVPEKLSGDTVLKANVELLKLHGAYPDKKSQVTYSAHARIESLSYDEANNELERIRIDTQELLKDSES